LRPALARGLSKVVDETEGVPRDDDGFSIICERFRRLSIEGPITLITRLFSKREPLPWSSTPPLPLLLKTQLRIVTLSALNDAIGPSILGILVMPALSFSP